MKPKAAKGGMSRLSIPNEARQPSAPPTTTIFVSSKSQISFLTCEKMSNYNSINVAQGYSYGYEHVENRHPWGTLWRWSNIEYKWSSQADKSWFSHSHQHAKSRDRPKPYGKSTSCCRKHRLKDQLQWDWKDSLWKNAVFQNGWSNNMAAAYFQELQGLTLPPELPYLKPRLKTMHRLVKTNL